MTAPESVAEAREVDLWRLIDAEGGEVRKSIDVAQSQLTGSETLWCSDPHDVGHHEAIEAALKHVEALGYSEGTPVPTAAHYAALKEAAEALRALVTAVTFADPPKLFNGVICHEARVPVEFIDNARAALEQSK